MKNSTWMNIIRTSIGKLWSSNFACIRFIGLTRSGAQGVVEDEFGSEILIVLCVGSSVSHFNDQAKTKPRQKRNPLNQDKTKPSQQKPRQNQDKTKPSHGLSWFCLGFSKPEISCLGFVLVFPRQGFLVLVLSWSWYQVNCV